MKVVEIRSEAELQKLKPAWEALLRDSASDTIFLTWEWAMAWWRAYGEAGELRILAAIDENATTVGIAPLRQRTVRKYGQAVSTLSFVGDHSADSDYLDFIIASGLEGQVMEAFRAYWAEELRRGTVLELNEIPETSPNLPLLKVIGAPESMLWTESDVPCGTVRLPATWSEYLGMLRPRFRTKVRSVLRSLEERPEVRFGFCANAEQLQRLLPVLFDLHTRRWAESGKPGVFGWERKRSFYFALSANLLERGWLRFSWLEWNGRVLACQYGFAYKNTYFQLQEGYDPASEHWNTGIGLRAWSIREFLKEGLHEYDFMAGMGRHKSDWGAETKRSKRIMLARRSPKALLYCGEEAWGGAKKIARQLIPGRILAIRQANVRRRNSRTQGAGTADNVSPVSPSGSEWIRNALANCYFRSGMPALMRPLRERYRLSVSGTKVGISLNRRKGPSARIVYYHRVNDDNDPFFPAISTALFEQQVRYIGRHYKVVSLAELVDHLNGDSRETVMAITFDDGYRDNYLSAFPILRSYGLPATIFLTTGSIDSREPMWFEQLLLGLKQTSREFVDLEIDIPRRFWLRTMSERLAANGRIFGLLKALPDAERRQGVAHVLRLLGAESTGERTDKMLTWPEIRIMKEYRMDFGGHTVSHPFLSRVPSEQVICEASECKRRIEEELQSPVRHFAYPNGREEDFGVQNMELIRAAGYDAAVTTIWGMNYQSTDRMALRRGGPWEATPASFASKLDWYQFIDG